MDSKAAAERLRDSAKAYLASNDGEFADQDHVAHWRDQQLVAESLLALLPPADDGEIATRAWILPFELPRTAAGAFLIGSFVIWSTGPTSDDKSRLYALGRSDFETKTLTRGDVRKVAAALSIPLTETK